MEETERVGQQVVPGVEGDQVVAEEAVGLTVHYRLGMYYSRVGHGCRYRRLRRRRRRFWPCDQ